MNPRNPLFNNFAHEPESTPPNELFNNFPVKESKRKYDGEQRKKEAEHRRRMKLHMAIILASQKQDLLEEQMERQATKLGISIDDMGVQGGIERSIRRNARAAKRRPKDCICPVCSRHLLDAKDWATNGKCLTCARRPNHGPSPIAPLVKNAPCCSKCGQAKPNPRTIIKGVCKSCIAKNAS